MSIKQALSKQPTGKGGGSTRRARGSQAAEIHSFADVMDDVPRQRILAFAAYKHGKTSFALSVFDFFEKQGYDPEEVMVGFVDNDDGVLPLARKGAVDKKWFPSMKYAPCSNFKQVEKAANELIPQLQAHKKEHGTGTAWFIMDNTQALWQWARDKYALDVYGMRESTLARKKRKEAESKGKYTLPVFKQEVDYGAINGMYGDLMEYIKLSGVNFIWLAPAKDEYEDNEPTGVKIPGGQKHDPGRVDNLVYLYREKGKYYGDLVGSRTADKLFKKMESPSLSKLIDFSEKVNKK